MSKDNTSNDAPEFRSLGSSQSLRTRYAICLLIFLTAFGVRLLSWHDTRLEVGKVQSVVTGDYHRVARLLRAGGIAGFLSSSSPLSDLNTLGHPPGYSILTALVFSAFGESNTAIQFVQMLCDAFAAVVIFLIAAELLPLGAAGIAGLMAAFSPQFSWNSVLLLPDSLAVLPILLAVYCLARAARNPRLVTFIMAGALVGISCWLRANTMLLVLFLAAVVPLLFKEERQWRYALAIVFGALLIVLPLTIRNAIVFHRFIPLSLGAGQTLLEGIADYDPQGRFNIPSTDMGIMKQEAEDFHRPDYYGTLFNPDGVERERARLSRGAGVIASHPLWFTSVMIRRAASMTRLERAKLISAWPAVTHSLDLTNSQSRSVDTADLLNQCYTRSSGAKAFSGQPDAAVITVVGDDSRNGMQFSLCPVPLIENMDYVLEIPIRIEQGRVRVSVRKPNVSEIVEPIEGKQPHEQPLRSIRLPFVASGSTADIELTNEASTTHPIIHFGTIKLYELGPARFLWTRYPRFVVHGIQRIFLTAVMLPLAIIGLGLLIFQKQGRALVVLSIVPLYFFAVQSIVHTEYRYVLAVDYFLFALAAVSVSWVINLVMARTATLLAHKS